MFVPELSPGWNVVVVDGASPGLTPPKGGSIAPEPPDDEEPELPLEEVPELLVGVEDPGLPLEAEPVPLDEEDPELPEELKLRDEERAPGGGVPWWW